MALIIIDSGSKRKAGENKDYVRKDELLVDGKVKPELLPDTTHEKTDLQPLAERVQAMEERESNNQEMLGGLANMYAPYFEINAVEDKEIRGDAVEKFANLPDLAKVLYLWNLRKDAGLLILKNSHRYRCISGQFSSVSNMAQFVDDINLEVLLFFARDGLAYAFKKPPYVDAGEDIEDLDTLKEKLSGMWVNLQDMTYGELTNNSYQWFKSFFGAPRTAISEIAVQSVRDEMEQHKADTARTIAELQSSLANAQKVIDWLGGDLLRVTPDIPTRDGKFAATRMFPFAVKLPGGIHAYALRTDRDLTKTIDFEMIGEGKDVPAYTPVFLMAKESKEYILSPTPYSAPIDTGLIGTLQPLTVEMRDHDKYKYFALVLNKKGEAQWMTVPNNKKIIIPPYRAFIRLPKDYVYKPAEAAEAAATTES